MAWLLTDEDQFVNSRYLRIVGVKPVYKVPAGAYEGRRPKDGLSYEKELQGWQIWGRVELTKGDMEVSFGSYPTKEGAVSHARKMLNEG